MLQNINKAKKLLLIAASLGIMGAIAACESPNTTTGTTTTESPVVVAESPLVSPTTGATPGSTTSPASGTVADALVATSDFSTLRQAVQAAGLESTLSQPGPYTVFAPTNQAFAALPAGTLDRLLLPENKQQLTKILTYHVIPGRVTSGDITPGNVNTVEGQPIATASSATTVTVNDATVIQPDVIVSNGVIHGIDKVLLPPDVQL